MFINGVTDFKKEVYVFGTGELGQRAYDYLLNHNISVEGFIDNNTEKQGTYLNNTLIYSVEGVSIKKDAFIVIASSWYEEIQKQLEKLNYKRIEDYIYFEEIFGIYGDFPNWEEALKLSSGYDSTAIVNKVAASIHQVKQGYGLFERDGFIINEPDYSLGLITSLLYLSKKLNRPLQVMDFGGSLGSTYYEVNKFFSEGQLYWHIIEQPIFVEKGRKEFESNYVKFYSDISECVQAASIDVVIFSSVLQYISNYKEIIDKVKRNEIPHILIDKMAFHEKDYNRVALQRVNPVMYDATYPVTIFNKQYLFEHFLDSYTIFTEYNSHLNIIIDGQYIQYRGVFFERK